MALTGAAFNDFDMYTHQSLFIERFSFDELFWTDAARKMGNNYFSYILPKLPGY